jgi:hypothetical protein
VLLGIDALSMVVLVAMVIAWPLAGILAFFVVRSWRRHDAWEREQYPDRPHHGH